MWAYRVLRPATAFAGRHLVAVGIVGLALSLLGTGCGDDIEIYRPPKDKDPYLPLTSPENVLHNLAKSYNMRDYAHVVPLFRDDFVFFFSRDAYGSVGVPYEGSWGCADELEATQKMFDQFHDPKVPEFRIESIKMALTLSGPLQETQLEGAPEGTLEALVALDLRITCAGGSFTFLVQSRPLFHFAPDEAGTTSVWRLWQCKDATFDDELSGPGRFSLPCDDQDGCGVRIDKPSHRGEMPAGVSSTQVTWGELKAFYRTGS